MAPIHNVARPAPVAGDPSIVPGVNNARIIRRHSFERGIHRVHYEVLFENMSLPEDYIVWIDSHYGINRSTREIVQRIRAAFANARDHGTAF